MLVALSRMLGGEAVKLNFSAGNGGYQRHGSGKVGGDAEKVANRDFWAQTLGMD